MLAQNANFCFPAVTQTIHDPNTFSSFQFKSKKKIITCANKA